MTIPAHVTPVDLAQRLGATCVPGQGAPLTVHDPARPDLVVAAGLCASPHQVGEAVAAAQQAFAPWAATPVVKRCRILLAAKARLEERLDELAALLVLENGKTRAEALGDLRRGLEVIEFAAGMPSLAAGRYVGDMAAQIDGFEYREPLGVVAGACPFNFPAMIPLWMFPVAIACGNTFILKPSDRCPATATRIVETFLQAGLPPGVLNLVQGGRQVAEALIDHPDVAAISFVGSTRAAWAVWRRATAVGKRVQALGGAKNFIVVMPDAPPAATVEGILGSTFGCAGERCMASSILLLVGEAQACLPVVVRAAAALRLGHGLAPHTEMGPLISASHRARVAACVEEGVEAGAELLLDGRQRGADDYPAGHFIGPTIFDRVSPGLALATEEIFGPVLSVMRAPDLDTALALVNGSAHGNGASIFTSSGASARTFRDRVDVGMVGINAGVPAPMAFFGFGGRRASFFGDLKTQGTDGMAFYTRQKAVIERWFDDAGDIWGS